VTILQDRFPDATPTTAPAVYAFGCGNCHPLDAAKHMDGSVQVALHDAGAPATSLKARAAITAAYDPGTGTCSGVYCHSSGQETPSFTTTPGWTSGVELACDGCHTNPPRYATGAPGSATANTHLLLRVPAAGVAPQLYGHFTWHNRYAGATTEAIGKHGVAGEGAAPMTCQACHYATVDPASTGPSGFYWLDTTGEYNLPGAALTYSCRSSGCHTGAPGEALQAKGRVLPLRHVNGVRDVAFDSRTAPPTYGVPEAPFTPDFPYWTRVLVFRDANVLPPGAAWNPPPVPTTAVASSGTLSFRLDAARYDASTKTCSSVPCHLRQSSVQWGGNVGTYNTCFGCHTNH
jgi:predicted CxxxxCH...CXXCH cytochrome family protein